MTSPEGYLMGLWMHECRRVFCDKLVNQADKDWIEEAIVHLCNENVDPKLASEVRFLLFYVFKGFLFRWKILCILSIS